MKTSFNHRRLARHFREGQRRAAINRQSLHAMFFMAEGYSEQCVMQSAAGFYLGTLAWCIEEWGSYWCPGSRDSGYFATAAEVHAAFPWAKTQSQAILDAGTEYASGPQTFMPRQTVERMAA